MYDYTQAKMNDDAIRAISSIGLAHLGDGPVWFASGTGPSADHIRAMPIRDAVVQMSQSTASMAGGD